MKSTKKIDNLFQEKLKDVEVTPPDLVWENIEAELDHKRKKRIIPIWWRTLGAAVVLLSIVAGGNYFLNTPSHSVPVENTITDSSKDSLIDLKKEPIPNTKNNPIENTIVDSKNSTNEPFINTQKIQKNNTPNETITSSDEQKELNKLFNETANSETDPSKQFLLTNSQQQLETNSTQTSEKGNFQFVISKNKGLSKNNMEQTHPLFANPLDLIQSNKSNPSWTPTSAGENSIDNSSGNNATLVATSNTPHQNSSNPEPENTDNIEILEPESIEKKVLTDEKWSVASIIAPVFHNSLNSKGSPMGNQFASNPKEGSSSISYGIKVGYKINKKISIQTGLTTMDLGYSVNEVYMNPTGIASTKLSNVTYNRASTIINVDASKEISSILPSETVSAEPIQGSINQEYGYVEVPLELKYHLIGGKFRTHLIAGFSTLILNENEVSVENSAFSSNIGEANNLNNVNFSGNFGLDFDYSLHKNLYLNVAPIFKIYTNTFSRDTDNFEPYSIGVYTGLNYRFD